VRVCDLLADLLDRAASLSLDVATGLLQHLLTLDLGVLGCGALVGLGGAPRAGDDLVRLTAGVLEPLTVVGQQLIGFLTGLVGGVDRLVDPVGAVVQRIADAREHGLA